MSTATVAKPRKSSERSVGEADVQSFRETVESIVVAFVLAFLFRAFVAEAFVIPTGSMAPTLMGAHKDVVCEYCGRQYQAGASKEFEQDSSRSQAVPRGRFSFSQPLSNIVSVASTCSTCRGVNAYDFREKPNHGTFSGDRILVSKFDYVLSKPKRWDVFVFKYPTEARMNYIKRLVGLPGEELLIRDGDVYTKTADVANWELARKPPHKIKSMRRIVSDSDYLAPILLRQGWPSLWQPLDDAAGAWDVHQPAGDVADSDGWSATLASSPQPQWLRYYHKFVSEQDWLKLRTGGSLAPAGPRESQLITDYLAYNSSYLVPRGAIYDQSGKLRDEISGDVKAMDVAFELADNNLIGIVEEDGENNDGFHWVGDLCSEFEIEVKSDTGTLLLDLVEFGIHYTCEIDVATGKALLYTLDGDQKVAVLPDAAEVTADTSLKGKGSYRVEMANVDDQIVLWVNGRVAQFSGSTAYDSYSVRNALNRRPHWTANDPLDAAPLAIGGKDLELSVTRAAVYRDIYYIAVQNTQSGDYSDYDWRNSRAIMSAIPDDEARESTDDAKQAIAEVYSHPQWWKDSNLFDLRGELRFDLEDDHYFPMGDNSAASSDARAWRGHHFVEQKFLLGKALLVFWPHTWNRPIPFTPNFARMGRIR